MKNKFFSRLLFVVFIYSSSFICFSINTIDNNDITNLPDFLDNMLQEEYEALEKIRNEDAHYKVDWVNAAREDALVLKNPKIFISLGMNCGCARNFERRKLSEAFFPFDWNISEPDSIYRILENDFKDFLKKENLVVKSGNPRVYHVFDTLYNIKIVHDFTKKGPALHDYEHVKDKYYRRVARFYHALTLKKPVYFFRAVITKQEALKLNQLIKKKFPELKYTLVVANNTEEFKKSWGIKNIKNFFLNNVDDPEEIKEWDKVFKALKIK